MLNSSSCPSCVWMQASPQSMALLRDLALSLSRAHTPHLSLRLWVMGTSEAVLCGYAAEQKLT